MCVWPSTLLYWIHDSVNRSSAKSVLTKTSWSICSLLQCLNSGHWGSEKWIPRTHSSADSEIKTGSRVWLHSESTLPVSLLSDLPHCRLASTCAPDSRTSSLSAREIPSLESEPRDNYKMATILQVYSCNFKRASAPRNVKHLMHMLLQCIRRSWL